MSISRSMAMNVVPLLLRFGVGVVFLWSGYAKLSQDMPVAGRDAALLAQVGVLAVPAEQSPSGSVPVPAAEPSPTAAPADQPPSSDPSAQPSSPPGDTAQRDQVGVTIIRAQAVENSERISAASFPDPVTVSRRHSITLVLKEGSIPNGRGKRLWPAALAKPWMLRALSWGVPLAEFIGGGLIIAGFITRLAALGLATMMAVAMLLTTIGPAVISGTAMLGFLPRPRLADADWIQAWQPMLFQLLLLLMASSLVLISAGPLSADRLVFGRRRAEPEPDDETDD